MSSVSQGASFFLVITCKNTTALIENQIILCPHLKSELMCQPCVFESDVLLRVMKEFLKTNSRVCQLSVQK